MNQRMPQWDGLGGRLIRPVVFGVKHLLITQSNQTPAVAARMLRAGVLQRKSLEALLGIGKRKLETNVRKVQTPACLSRFGL